MAPIGAERRRSPPAVPRPEVSWSTGRLLGPADCKCDQSEQGLVLEFLDPLSWSEDRGHGPFPARRLPDSPRPASPDCRRGEFPRSCPTPKPAPPGHDNPTPRIPDLIVTGPRVRPPDSTRRPIGEPIEDAEDRGPGATWARRVGWHQGDSLPHVDKAQRCPVPRCPCGRLRMPAAPFGLRAGSLPATPGEGSSPCPSRWNITRTQRGESGGTINVAAKSLEEAYRLLMAAVEEPGWGLLQEEADEDAGLRSGRVRRRE